MGFPQNSGQGGYEQSPFSNETALPPPPSSQQRQPLAAAKSGGAGAQGLAAPPQPLKPAGQPGGGYPPAPAFAPPASVQNPPAAQDGGGKSDLDLEIEKYQREIEDKQPGVNSGGGGFAPPPPQQAYQAPPPFQPEPYSPGGGGYDDMAPMPHNSAIFEFEAELSASVNKNNSESDEEYPSDSAVFFSSVNKNAPPRRTGKMPVVNPAKQKNAQPPQKGLMSKLFNKNQ
jgi:hypothetical protein